MGQFKVEDFFIRETTSIGEALACIDRSGRVSVALVVDDQGRLLNTITDGDVRRGILNGSNLIDPVSELLKIKARTPLPAPITAPVGTDGSALLLIMQKRAVRQVPLLDECGRPVDIAIISDLLPQELPQLRAVVMAGGQGTRLQPLTQDLPKPMLPIAGRPLMERIIGQLRDVGIHDVDVTTHYRAEKIMEHFGNGEAFGVQINYINEDEPLGTGGALGLMAKPSGPLLVINGDVLTELDFRSMLAFHQEHRASLTVAVRKYELQVPYGVIECDGVDAKRLQEKPRIELFVNAGIYLLEPSVFDYIDAKAHMNMTELIQRLLDAGERVVSFPICEYWLDIGQHDDYAQAQEDARSGRWNRVQAAT
jgi:dTDP-glucose pyrophosphorylase/CBS domain-containing protein